MKGVYVFALISHTIPSFAFDSHRVEFIDLDGLHAAIERRGHEARDIADGFPAHGDDEIILVQSVIGKHGG